MKKHREYSKLVCSCALIGVGMVIAFACVMIWVTQDTGALEWLVGGAFTTAAAIIGFYLWRAKAKDKLQMYKNDPEAYIAAGLGNDEDEEAGG